MWQVMPALYHGECSFQLPPCASFCGSIPSKCEVTGFISNDFYLYWLDKTENACQAIKSPVPRGWVSWLADSAWGKAALGIVGALGDGKITPGDIITLFTGWRVADDVKSKIREQKMIQKMIGMGGGKNNQGDSNTEL